MFFPETSSLLAMMSAPPVENGLESTADAAIHRATTDPSVLTSVHSQPGCLAPW